MKKLYRYLTLGLFFCLLFVGSKTFGHSVQVAYCVSCDGVLRIYVEHWHGETVGATTMDIELDVGGVIITVSGEPAAFIFDTGISDLPGCATPLTVLGQCDSIEAPDSIPGFPGIPSQCGANTCNYWVVYEFPGVQTGVPIIITVLSGNNQFTEDGCTMFPAVSPSFTIPRVALTSTSPACPDYKISGSIYYDKNDNCLLDGTDQTVDHAMVMLYDENDKLLIQRYSAQGEYAFSILDSAGTYTVKLKTDNFPFEMVCASPGLDTTVTLTLTNQLASNVNFNVNCVSDIGIHSVVTRGRVFPGQQHQLSVFAGDRSSWYNMSCTSPTSETSMTVSVEGPVRYDGILPGALTPIAEDPIFPNRLTYTIPNWANINMKTDFGLLFTTDTTAQAGDEICVIINMTYHDLVKNTKNNSYKFCYDVMNSYDPNIKEVYPGDIEVGYADWLTYTIHFQNTGNAPAINIRLRDTLDTKLNLETFQVINYSHANSVSIYENHLDVFYDNINLPDSASNPEGSQGFVQYRIKPKTNLPVGTLIKNKAAIYFDFNPPIITNTTVNEFKVATVPIDTNEETETVSIIENEETDLFSVYPNPSNGEYYIQLSEGVNTSDCNVEVYNSLGELIFTKNITSGLSQIDLSQQPSGVYFIRLKTEENIVFKKLIISK